MYEDDRLHFSVAQRLRNAFDIFSPFRLADSALQSCLIDTEDTRFHLDSDSSFFLSLSSIELLSFYSLQYEANTAKK